MVINEDILYFLFFFLFGYFQIHMVIFVKKKDFLYGEKYKGLRDMFYPLPDIVSYWFSKICLFILGSFLIFFSFYSY